MYSRLSLVFFSPTGSTKRVVEKVAAAFPVKPRLFDLTEKGQPAPPCFDEDDFVLFAVPAFSGRVPQTAVEHFRSLSSKGAQAAVIVTYGHRAYDDALLELRNLLKEKGFSVVGAGAFVTQHSIVTSIASGRPNQADLDLMREFGERLAQKASDALPMPKIKNIPGNPTYRTYQNVPIHPIANRNCKSCGICAAHCPTNAIPAATPQKTDRSRCVCCMRCVAVCPRQGRTLTKPALWAARRLIEKKCAGERVSEIFL